MRTVMGGCRWGGRPLGFWGPGRGRADRGAAAAELGMLTAAIAALTVGASAGVLGLLGAELSVFMDDLRSLIGG